MSIRYRYHPPKSNVWGHSLRKIPPSVLDHRVNEFLKALSVELKDLTFELIFYCTATDDPVAQLEYRELLDGFSLPVEIPEFTAPQSASTTLAEFHTGLELLCDRDKRPHSPVVNVVLYRRLRILRWNINGVPVQTQARLVFMYGTDPYVGTEIIFNNEAEFAFLAQEFYAHFKVRLNPKHLKALRASMKNYYLWP